MGDYSQLMAHRFQDLRVPARDLTLDEFTMPWRGRHRARCFNPSKPCRYHLKGFSLNEATTGYCCNFAMYEGRDEKRPPGVTATSWPVLNLVGGWTGIHNKGYHLWADNWFSGDLTAQTRVQLPFLDFLLAVVDELKPTSKKAPPTPNRAHGGNPDTHTPIYTYGKAVAKRSKEEWSTRPANEKRWYGQRCAACGDTKSRFKCKECDVYLHVHDDELGRTCWANYHSSLH